MTIHVRAVPWHDPIAAAFRDAMRAEHRLVAGGYAGAGELAPDLRGRSSAVAYTGIAYNSNDLPVGLVAMCWSKPGELELQRMYVMPTHRGRGATLPLLAAAERAALALGAARITVRADHSPPDAIRLYQLRGFQPVPACPGSPNSRLLAKTVSAQVTY